MDKVLPKKNWTNVVEPKDRKAPPKIKQESETCGCMGTCGCSASKTAASNSPEAQAEQLGRAAFHDGVKAVPALDPALKPLIGQCGSDAKLVIKILEAWTKGWHDENLKAPVEGWTAKENEDLQRNRRKAAQGTCKRCKKEGIINTSGTASGLCDSCEDDLLRQTYGERESKATACANCGLEPQGRLIPCAKCDELICEGCAVTGRSESGGGEYVCPPCAHAYREAAQFGSVEWQEEMERKIRQKMEKGERLNESEEAFIETQGEHNKRMVDEQARTSRKLSGSFTKKATGEPDQDYDHETYDAITKALEAEGYQAKHKEFDKYQGVYIRVSGNGVHETFWTEDVFFTGTRSDEGTKYKYKSAELYNADGELAGGSKGDYFMLAPNKPFPEGYTLVLTKMDGTQEVIESPTYADFPESIGGGSEVQPSTFTYKPGTEQAHYIFYPESQPEYKIEYSEGVGIGDFLEFLESKKGQKKGASMNRVALKLWTSPSDYMGEEYPDYYVGPSQTRDSEALERSNFKSALEMLGGESEGVIVARFGHWAVGWVETILVHKDAKDKVAILQDIENKMADYPVLDDDDFYQMESEQRHNDYTTWAKSDAIDILAGEIESKITTEQGAKLVETFGGSDVSDIIERAVDADGNLDKALWMAVEEDLEYGDGTALHPAHLIECAGEQGLMKALWDIIEGKAPTADNPNQLELPLEGLSSKKPGWTKAALKEEWHVEYFPHDSDKRVVKKGFTSKAEAEAWAKAENLNNTATDLEVVKASLKKKAGKTVALVGFYNQFGYQIWEQNDAGEIFEVAYEAGNHEQESSAHISPDSPMAVPVEKLEEFCNQTGEEMAQEMGVRWLGSQYDKDLEEELRSEVKASWTKAAKDWETCTNCGGDGYVDGKECPACEGTGRLPKTEASVKRKAAEERMINSYDTTNIIENQVKFLMGTEGDDVDDWWMDGEVKEAFEEAGGDAKKWHELLKAKGLESKAENQASEAAAEDVDLFQHEWEFFLETMTEDLTSRNPNNLPWRVDGSELGWQKRTGYKYINTNDGEEFMRSVLPNTDTTIEVYDAGDAIHFKVYHHDAPTGEHYYARPEQPKDDEEMGAESGLKKFASKLKDKVTGMFRMARPSTEHIRAIKSILSNDEASSDEELLAHFQKEFGLSPEEAKEWILKRNDYLNMKLCQKCGMEGEEQSDRYGIYQGVYCEDCYQKTYRQDWKFDPADAGESLEEEASLKSKAGKYRVVKNTTRGYGYALQDTTGEDTWAMGPGKTHGWYKYKSDAQERADALNKSYEGKKSEPNEKTAGVVKRLVTAMEEMGIDEGFTAGGHYCVNCGNREDCGENLCTHEDKDFLCDTCATDAPVVGDPEWTDKIVAESVEYYSLTKIMPDYEDVVGYIQDKANDEAGGDVLWETAEKYYKAWMAWKGSKRASLKTKADFADEHGIADEPAVEDLLNNETPMEPAEGDVIIQDEGALGAATVAYADGKQIAKLHDDWDKFYGDIYAWMKKENYYPNVWNISDHGNVSEDTGFGEYVGKQRGTKTASAEQDGVSVELEDIGEGISGDYNPEDPNDIPLLRFYILKDGEEVPDGSYCTQIPATVDEATKKKFEQIILDRVHDIVLAGESVKKIGEELSWLGEDTTKTAGRDEEIVKRNMEQEQAAVDEYRGQAQDASPKLKKVLDHIVEQEKEHKKEFEKKEIMAADESYQGLGEFVGAYLEAALWSSMDGSDDQGGDPLDQNYDFADIAPESMERAKKDCADFQAKAGDLLNDVSDEQAGHDFWLTRNRHGAGFWDRGLGDVGDKLTEIAHSFGEVNLIVGDDNKLYLEGSLKKQARHASVEDYLAYLKETYIPDLMESGKVETADDFKKIVSLIESKGQDAEFVEFLTTTLIPDLYVSGDEATAEDFEDGIYWMTGKVPKIKKQSFVEGGMNKAADGDNGPEYAKYKAKADAIIKKYQRVADSGRIVENLGVKDLSKFRDEVGQSKLLSWSWQQNLITYLSQALSSIVPSREASLNKTAAEVSLQDIIKNHGEHEIEMAYYGNPPQSNTVECMDCNEILVEKQSDSHLYKQIVEWMQKRTASLNKTADETTKCKSCGDDFDFTGLVYCPDCASVIERQERAYNERLDDPQFETDAGLNKQAKYTGNMEADLKAIAPYVIADGVCDNDAETSDWLVERAKAIYKANPSWGKKISKDDESARDMLTAFMAHWLEGRMKNPDMEPKMAAEAPAAGATREQKIQQAIEMLSKDPDIIEIVQKIEGRPATTKGHYGDYMRVLDDYKKNRTMMSIVAQALIGAGANAEGVNAALGIMSGSAFGSKAEGPFKEQFEEWECPKCGDIMEMPMEVSVHNKTCDGKVERVRVEAGLSDQVKSLRRKLKDLDVEKADPSEIASTVDALEKLEKRLKDQQETRQTKKDEKAKAAAEEATRVEAGLSSQVKTLRKKLKELDVEKADPSEIASTVDALERMEKRLKEQQETRKNNKEEKAKAAEEAAKTEVTAANDNIENYHVFVPGAEADMLFGIDEYDKAEKLFNEWKEEYGDARVHYEKMTDDGDLIEAECVLGGEDISVEAAEGGLSPQATKRYNEIKKIVDEHQYAKIDGVTVDGFTASMLLQIADALGAANKEKFLSMPIVQMVDIGWKLVKKTRASLGRKAFFNGDEFFDYCWSFYGPGEMYGEYFNNELTKEDMVAAIKQYVADGKIDFEHGGDTVDREAVRDILLALPKYSTSKKVASGAEEVMRGQAGPRQVGKIWVKHKDDGSVVTYSTHFADKAEFDKYVADHNNEWDNVIKQEFPVPPKKKASLAEREAELVSFVDVYNEELESTRDPHQAVENALSLFTGGVFDAAEGEQRRRMIEQAMNAIQAEGLAPAMASFTAEAATNESVIQMFAADSFPKDKMPTWGTQNLKINKEPNGWSLINYSTPIAYRSNDGKTFINTQKYSVTTSKIQNVLKQAMGGASEVDEAGMKAAMSEVGTSPVKKEAKKPIEFKACFFCGNLQEYDETVRFNTQLKDYVCDKCAYTHGCVDDNTVASLNKTAEEQTTITIKGYPHVVEIMDNTHLRLRPAESAKWMIPMHIAQVDEEIISQLRELGIVQGGGEGKGGAFFVMPKSASMKKKSSNPMDNHGDIGAQELANGDLEISVGEQSQKELAAYIKETDDTSDNLMYDVFEHLMGNGYTWLQPEDIGALTDAPIMTDGGYADDGTVDLSGGAKVWWYPNYAVRSPMQDLAETGKVVFTLAPEDKEVESSQKRYAKYFDQFKSSDLAGSAWELDKESRKLKRKKSTLKIQSTADFFKNAGYKFNAGDVAWLLTGDKAQIIKRHASAINQDKYYDAVVLDTYGNKVGSSFKVAEKDLESA